MSFEYANNRPVLMNPKYPVPVGSWDCGGNGAGIVRILDGQTNNSQSEAGHPCKGVQEAKDYLRRVKDTMHEVEFFERKVKLQYDAIAGYEAAVRMGTMEEDQAQHLIDGCRSEIENLQEHWPEKLMARSEAMSGVIDLVDQLESSTQRLIILKRYVDRMSWEEIACDLDMKVRTVQKEHGRALILLEDVLMNKQ